MITGNHRLTPRALLFAVAVLLLLAPACGDGVGNEGDLVGGPCRDSQDCADICLTGSDFPEGTCSIPCRFDEDCPGGTACIDEDGGVCLLLCHFDTDCRHGYECDDESRKGHPGNAAVCIED